MFNNGDLIKEVKKISGIETQLESKVSKIPNTQNIISLPYLEGDVQGCHPSVKYFENGWNGFKYWMAYTPFPDTNEKKENPYVVNSNDGFNWQPAHGNTPLAIPDKGFSREYLSDTELVFNSTTNTLECWYRRCEDEGARICRRKSTNGRDWTTEEELATFVKAQACMSHTVIYEDSKYKIWYVDRVNTVQNSDNNLIYCESTNGGSWTNTRTCNVPSCYNDIWHTSVAKIGNKYYHILNKFFESTKYLYYTVSEDNITFSVPKLIITPTVGGWDSKEIYRSSLIFLDDKFRLYYNGNYNTNNPFRNKWYIGVCEGQNLDKLIGLNNYQDLKYRQFHALKIQSHLRSDLNNAEGCTIRHKNNTEQDLIFEHDSGNLYSLTIQNLTMNWAKLSRALGVDFELNDNKLRLTRKANGSITRQDIWVKPDENRDYTIVVQDGKNFGGVMVKTLILNSWHDIPMTLEVDQGAKCLTMTHNGVSYKMQPNFYMDTATITSTFPNPPNGFRVFDSTLGKELIRHGGKWVDAMGNIVR